MAKILDEAWSKVDPHAAVAAGYSGIVGYVSEDTTGKNLTRAQIDAMHAAGLDVGLVYEYATGAATLGAARGTRDGSIALAHALNLGAPVNVALYCAVDLDVQASDMPAVVAYVNAFRDAVHSHGFRCGVYGGYAVCWAVGQANLGVMLWQTYAWSHGMWCKGLFVRQLHNGIMVAGANVDQDETEVVDWGQWPTWDTPGSQIGVEDMAGLTDAQAQQLQDLWDWTAALADPDGNPPTRSRFNWPALKLAARLDAIQAALAAIATSVANQAPLTADQTADLHTIAEDLRKLTG